MVLNIWGQGPTENHTKVGVLLPQKNCIQCQAIHDPRKLTYETLIMNSVLVK